MAILQKEFYNRDTVEVAQDLLGRVLVRRLNHIALAGRIVETEAYIGRCDKACHAYPNRRTPRTEALYLPPGHAYIYLVYGMHHCLNLVTEAENEPAAVLIRALQPVAGENIMYRLRYGEKPLTSARKRGLCDGPGKLCQAMGLTREENGISLTGNILFVCDAPSDFLSPENPYDISTKDLRAFQESSGNISPENLHEDNFPRILPGETITASPRIGIDYAEEARFFPWRFRLMKS